MLYNLIIKQWGIPSYYLYIFSKSLEQDVYQELKKACEKLSVEEDIHMAHFFNSSEELILVDDCEPNSLVVFDNCVNIQQQEQNIKDYFVRRCH